MSGSFGAMASEKTDVQEAMHSAEDAMLVHGEGDASAARWIERHLVSPLYGALVHVAEGAGLLAEADVVAGRVYEAFDARPCAYVGTPGLELSPRQRVRLQRWPLTVGSIFDRLTELGVVDRPVSPREVCLMGTQGDDVRWQSPGLEPVLHPACRLADGFIVTLPIEHRCWAALLLLRHRQRPRFDDAHRDAVMTRRSILRNVLRRGLAAQQPPPLSAATLHARLSRTERDVLELLCQNKTEREVAEHFDRSPHTVHVHVKSIYRKLGVHSRMQLLRVTQAMGENGGPD